MLLTGTNVRQQGVVVRQRFGVDHVEARDQGGRRAVDPLLLRRLHAVRRVQEGVSAERLMIRTKREVPHFLYGCVSPLIVQPAESRTDRQDPVDLQRVVQLEAVPVLVDLLNNTDD